MSDLFNETTTNTNSEVVSNSSPDNTSSSNVSSSNSILDSGNAPATVVDVAPPPSDWRSSLPEDVRNDPTLSNIKDVESLAKSHISAQRMLGGRIPIPSKEASQEVRDEFYNKLNNIPDVVRLPDPENPEYSKQLDEVYNKLGRPQSPDRYEINNDHKIPLDEDFLTSAKATAHKMGLNKDQFKAMSDIVLNRDIQMREVFNKQHDVCKGFLEKEWGNAFSDNLSAAKSILSKFAQKMPDAVEEIKNGYASNNPVVIMMASELGRMYQESGTIGTSSGVRSGSRTPEQAKEMINEIMLNWAHPYWNDRDPANSLAQEKVQALYRDAHPEPKENNI